MIYISLTNDKTRQAALMLFELTLLFNTYNIHFRLNNFVSCIFDRILDNNLCVDFFVYHIER